MQKIKNINIQGGKKKVMQNYANTMLARVLAGEPDIMTVEEFLAKVPTWLALADLEQGVKNSSSREGLT